ncbi:adenylate/guanylate cyclase domain-containing protein [Nisaea nitritireducens]|uniref:adenylate/guanylate cyclase domain-containing protein n=1 Tax=Nisaea nitritireducens TaxID=568392 RepID=UPI00186881D5|nr:adenylate/guanylate cyclase domain-containing protein [Nisaea nitritireducens]
MSLSTKNLRLRPVILTLFIILTLPVFLTIVAVNYVSNQEAAHVHAEELLYRFNNEAIDNIEQLFEPIKSLIRSAAALGGEQPEFYEANGSITYLHSILEHSDVIISAYVGLEDGSFRQARQIDPEVEVQGRLPPTGTRYADRWIARASGEVPVDHYVFLDAGRSEIGRSEKGTSYDPRARLWYETALASGGMSVSDVDVFAVLDLVGFTVGAPFYGPDGNVRGVAAADITLDGMSDYLAESNISSGTVSFILDHQGGVIANSRQEKTYGSRNGRPELMHVTSLGDDLPAVAFSLRPRDREGMYTIEHQGREYVASLTTFPASFGKAWQLFVVTPLSDFTSTLEKRNRQLFIFGLIAILVQIIIIYFLSGVISAPLERLAVKVMKIKDLEVESPLSLQTPIREVALLGRAIDTLDTTVKSFASFVPVDLVRQLLDTDQKLALGGYNKFLTVFFSDIEGFSTLSESTPSKQLLQRVSTYLEAVTRATKLESGTIDKFIGDGVMAFWGAPNRLDDHAMHACFAALRIQHEMARLNADWTAQGMLPLNIRIGIHSDAVLVGNIGSSDRMNYTVMGDGVNIAARLEGINKDYGTRICISHTVFKEAGDRLCVRPIDEVAVKGRRGKVPIYELVGAYDLEPAFEPDERLVRLCSMTRDAYEALVAEDLDLALERYNAILAEYPDDTVAAEMARRLTATSVKDTIPTEISD